MTDGAAKRARAVGDDWARLIAAIARDGDRDAFAKVFGHFAPRLHAYLLRLGTAPNVADELVQETMLRVWRKAGRFTPESGAASTWIFVIARNLRVDRLRRERSERGDTPDPTDWPDAAPGGEAELLAVERHERLRKALGALPEEQAKILRLSFFEDRPHAEIAQTLGVPLGTVKSRTRLAVSRLRALLDDLT